MEYLYWMRCIKIEKDFSPWVQRGETSAFIICEQTEDEELIEKLAISLRELGCREAYFYGKQENLWRNIFNLVDLNAEDYTFMMTLGYKKLEHFLHSVHMQICANQGERSLCLFYDDEEIFQKVIGYLVEKKKNCPLMSGLAIDSDLCFEYSMVADRFITPSTMPEEITAKENFREICQKCKYHDIDGGGAKELDMSKPKGQIVLDMLEMLFNGEYDPFEFSLDFPDFCFEHYDELEEECEGLGYYLDQNAPEICDDGEPGFNPTRMITALKNVYRVARRKIERGGKMLLLDKVTIKVGFQKTYDVTLPNGNNVSANINDTLIVNRLDETIEYYRNVFEGTQIAVKYHVEYYLQTLLEHVDARDLFYEVGRTSEETRLEEEDCHNYEIIVEAEGMEPRIIEGRYCADELPEDYAYFINLIIKARDIYGGVWGDIFNAKLYKKRVTKGDGLIYCAVEFEEDGREYHYITDDDTIEEGDRVIVPVGKNNHEAEAIVVEKIYCTEETAPYPISSVKKIIGKKERKEETE